ncbi:hypothetical protein HAX54_020503 [Datura stramonium]|uniref:C2 domain-containing protein n=1 Tax=Datura stramonium TaxID=4076 RepID=A0ABS8URZ4_DATST|nr:hypothetical protein [Datura stramonium]
MQFLFVRVVKAQDLPHKDITGSLDPYVEVRVGNYKGVTQHFEKNQSPEWNTVFAFAKERMQSSVLDVVVKDKDMLKDDFVGIVRIDLHEVPTRVAPDSPLAPEWYRLENKKGEKKKGELMLAVWIAQDLVVSEKNRFPDVCVKARIGNQVLRTKPIRSQTMNVLWNEDLMFVAAEPFEEHLILSVDDRIASNKDEALGVVFIPLNTVERRADDRFVRSRWYNLQEPGSTEVEEPKKKDKFSSRIHLRVSLDGGYHVLDESTHYSSDLRPTAKQLWKPSIGILELGILNVDGLHPSKTRDGRGTSDTYCVAKYGHKWAARLSRAEPPLRKEVVEYMSDADAHLWSMRRSKANFFRLMSVFGGLFSVGKWVLEPLRTGQGTPPHMNTRISHADSTHPDELDEEFDTFPTSRSSELVRMRCLKVLSGFYAMRHPRFRLTDYTSAPPFSPASS